MITRKILAPSGLRALVELAEEGVGEYERLSRELRRLLEAVKPSTA